MKSLLKNVLRRISKKQSSKEDNATAFYPQCCAKVDDVVGKAKNITELLIGLSALAEKMNL